MKNSVSGNVSEASILDCWHMMKVSGLKIKIILIKDEYETRLVGRALVSLKEMVTSNYRSRAGVGYRKYITTVIGHRPS
ncbi:MAG: hypothetical protein PVI82_14250 [Desulfobacterales bacterium]|jgi:hypothetical protein